MATRYLLVGPVVLALAGAATAAPLAPEQKVEQPTPSRAPAVVLASAEQAVPPGQSPDAQAATPAKRPRAARVTSCRCAGQTSTPAQADQ